MINQTRQGRYRSDSHFLIEISFILPNKQKKSSYLCVLVKI